MLRNTSRLRFHRAEYVRLLAAQSVGYLLRQAPKAALAGALRVVVRQQALAPTVERTQVGGICSKLFVRSIHLRLSGIRMRLEGMPMFSFSANPAPLAL